MARDLHVVLEHELVPRAIGGPTRTVWRFPTDLEVSRSRL